MSRDDMQGTTPELRFGSHLVPGLAAVALFVVMAAVFLTSTFPLPEPAGFPEDASVIASIGYAMFNLDGGKIASEGLLAVFEIVDLVLVAALTGAILLAKRGDEGVIPTAYTDGGTDESLNDGSDDPTTEARD